MKYQLLETVVLSSEAWKTNGKMSKKSNRPVSEIVETYRIKYPQTERPALRRLILSEHKEINPRTLDRHLRKAFSPFKREKEYEATAQPESILHAPWKEHAFQDFRRVRDMIADGSDYNLVRAPENLLLCIKTVLPEELKEKLKPEIMKLENRINWANNTGETNIFKAVKMLHMRLVAISLRVVPEILEKVFKLIHEA